MPKHITVGGGIGVVTGVGVAGGGRQEMVADRRSIIDGVERSEEGRLLKRY